MGDHTKQKNGEMEVTHMDTKIISLDAPFSSQSFKVKAAHMVLPGFVFRNNKFMMNQKLGDLASHLEFLKESPFSNNKYRPKTFGTMAAASKWALAMVVVFDCGKACCASVKDIELPLPIEDIAVRIMTNFKKGGSSASPGVRKMRELGKTGFKLLMQYAIADQKPVTNEAAGKLSPAELRVLNMLRNSIREMFEINNKHTNTNLVYSPTDPGPSNKDLEKLILQQQGRIDSLMFCVYDIHEQKKVLEGVVAKLEELDTHTCQRNSRCGEMAGAVGSSEVLMSCHELAEDLRKVKLERDGLVRRLRVYELVKEEPDVTRNVHFLSPC